MLFPPKNCYRLSSYYFSVVCFVAAGILFSIAYISGLFRNHLIFAVPLIGVCAFFAYVEFLRVVKCISLERSVTI